MNYYPIDESTQYDYLGTESYLSLQRNYHQPRRTMVRVPKRRPSTETEDDSNFDYSQLQPLTKTMKVNHSGQMVEPMIQISPWSFDRHMLTGENMPIPKANISFPDFAGKYPSRSRDGRFELKIVIQPEDQHRARYMTEGSRGAIKDHHGVNHPSVRLVGGYYPVKVDCYIGHDKNLGMPHLFYQASRINSKNVTKCSSMRVEGTTVISFELDPSQNMQTVVDCVGILKERNVDVEQKVNRGKKVIEIPGAKKRSTKCRMVFRCTLPETKEVLMVMSHPILCTQPSGSPEVSKKSLDECDVSGGKEIFLVGKNFTKHSKLVWKSDEWECVSDPIEEFVHATHIIAPVPAYTGPNFNGEVHVNFFVRNSDGKTSGSQPFIFTRSKNVMVTDNMDLLSQAQSINSMSIMSETELLGIINPSTFGV